MIEGLGRRHHHGCGCRTRSIRSLMDPMLAAFELELSSVTFSEPQIPIVSTVTGRPATAGDLASVDYWLRHTSGTVLFADAVAAADAGTFLEIGSDTALTPLVDGAVGLQRRDRDEVVELLTGVGQAYIRGVPVDWRPSSPAAVGSTCRRTRSSATATGWTRWRTRCLRLAGLQAADHPLFGAIAALPDGAGGACDGAAVAADPPVAG